MQDALIIESCPNITFILTIDVLKLSKMSNGTDKAGRRGTIFLPYKGSLVAALSTPWNYIT